MCHCWSSYLFVCLGLTSLRNIWGHITTVPACSSGTLTNMLPHRNAMPQTQDTTPHPITVYRHGADLSLCYPLMWNVTLEYTATHFNVLGETRPGNPSPTFHTHQRMLNYTVNAVMVVKSRKLSRKYRANRVLNPGNLVRYPGSSYHFLHNVSDQGTCIWYLVLSLFCSWLWFDIYFITPFLTS